jgi:hypothetical protein
MLLFAFACGRAQAPDPAAGKCRVAGQVVHFTAGTPVRKVSVRLKRFGAEGGVSDAPSVSNYATTSDAQGKFLFDAVEPGVYWLYADRTGYLEQSYGAREPLLKGSPLKLAAGQHRDDLVMKLTPQSFVYGKVADEDGDLLPNAQVQVYRAGWAQGRKRFEVVGSATSQDDGSFVIGNLGPGRYYLSAAQPHHDDDPQPDGLKLHETYATTYYPSGAEASVASPVDVAAGADVRGLEIRMRLARVFRVRGKAVNTLTGGAAAQAYLKLTPLAERGEPGHLEVGVSTGRDGLFEFKDVAPGDYVIETGATFALEAGSTFSLTGGTTFQITLPAQPEGAPKSLVVNKPLIGRVTVHVGEQDLDNVVFPLGDGALVTGTIRMTREDSSKPSPWPSLMLAPADGQGEEPVAAQVKADGTFRIPRIVPDQYSVKVDGLPDGAYVKSVHFDGHDITGEDLNLASGAGGLLEIVLSPDAAAVSGIVRGADGEAAAGATVQVCAGDDTVKYVSANENGEYKVGGLPPGDYRILAWEEVEPGLSLDASFRARFEAQMAAVKLEERAHSTVEVKVIAREAIEAEAAKLK